jgi:predicted alpha/beta hydrolase family esterase
VRVLIRHGWQNRRPEGHWLAGRLRDDGHEVRYPQFPEPDRVLLVAADDDPYFPGGAASLYADRFGLDADVVPGGRHLDLPAGYGSWPSVLAWCTDPSVRITAR